MIKKIFTTILASLLLLSVAGEASAQSSIGGGYLNSRYNMSYDGVTMTMTGQGAYAGISGCLWLPVRGLYLESGAYWNYAKVDIFDSVATADLHYVSVPIRFRYEYQFTYDYSVFLSAGPSASYRLSDKLSFQDGETKVSDGTAFFGDNARKLNFQAGFEVGFKLFKHLQIKGGYDWGLMNLVADNSDGASMRLDNLHAGIAYQF